MRVIPSLELFRNTTTGDYCLQNFAMNPKNGFRVACGALIPIPASHMKSQGLEIIQTNLSNFNERDGSQKSELNQLPRNEQRRFYNSHESISISLPSSKVLAFQGSTKTGVGASVGTPEQRVEIAFPSTQEQFYNALVKAFELCE